jgi:Flp pilus assembly protein TadG
LLFSKDILAFFAGLLENDELFRSDRNGDLTAMGIFNVLRALHKLRRNTRADTALEFALIGSAFFLFVFIVFVVSIDQFWQMVLDDAVRNATRQVAIGKITATSTPSFVTVVCNEFGIAAPYCASTLQYSVQGGTSFSAITPATLNADGTLSGGAVGAVVTGNATPTFPGVTLTTPPTVLPTVTHATPQFLLVQVAYPLPFKIPLVPGGVATENGTPSLISTVATAMEP